MEPTVRALDPRRVRLLFVRYMGCKVRPRARADSALEHANQAYCRAGRVPMREEPFAYVQAVDRHDARGVRAGADPVR